MDREAQAFELYWIQKRNSLIAKYYTILHFAFNALLQKIAGIPSQNHHNPKKPETVYRSLDLDHFMSFDELKEDKCTILCMYTWLIFSTRRVQKVSIQYIFAVLNMPMFRWQCSGTFPWTPSFHLHNPNINIWYKIHSICLSTFCTTCSLGSFD